MGRGRPATYFVTLSRGTVSKFLPRREARRLAAELADQKRVTAEIHQETPQGGGSRRPSPAHYFGLAFGGKCLFGAVDRACQSLGGGGR